MPVYERDTLISIVPEVRYYLAAMTKDDDIKRQNFIVETIAETRRDMNRTNNNQNFFRTPRQYRLVKIDDAEFELFLAAVNHVGWRPWNYMWNRKAEKRLGL